jgi:hypothetical protein
MVKAINLSAILDAIRIWSNSEASQADGLNSETQAIIDEMLLGLIDI